MTPFWLGVLTSVVVFLVLFVAAVVVILILALRQAFRAPTVTPKAPRTPPPPAQGTA